MKAVLSVYQAVRLPLGQQAATRSFENGLFYDFIHPEFNFDLEPSREQLAMLGKAVGDSFAWLGEGGCSEDWIKAEEMLLALDV